MDNMIDVKLMELVGLVNMHKMPTRHVDGLASTFLDCVTVKFIVPKTPRLHLMKSHSELEVIQISVRRHDKDTGKYSQDLVYSSDAHSHRVLISKGGYGRSLFWIGEERSIEVPMASIMDTSVFKDGLPAGDLLPPVKVGGKHFWCRKATTSKGKKKPVAGNWDNVYVPAVNPRNWGARATKDRVAAEVVYEYTPTIIIGGQAVAWCGEE